MASLYIKNEKVYDRVRAYAKRLGTTQTETLIRALDALEPALPPENPRADLKARLDALHAAHPLPPRTGKVDKAFFDALWDDAD